MFYLYNKISKKFEEIAISNRCRDTQLATNIELPSYDGNFQEVFFNEEKQEWIIVEKSDKNYIEIQQIKKQKLKQLEEEYANTKTIYVNNGNSFVLKKTDKDYERFREIIDNAINGTERNDFIKVNFFFVSKEDKCKYSITLMNYIWRYVFSKSQQQRKHNTELEEVCKVKIEILAEEGKIKELQDLSFNFSFPDGFVVDVNTLIENLLYEIKTGKTKEGKPIKHPQEVIEEMQNFLNSQVDKEHIELVKKKDL